MKALEKVKQEMAKERSLRPAQSVETLLSTDVIRKRFEDVLGKKAAGFISSVISAKSTNPQLATCEPMSVISAAMIAATLDLPINASLGFAHIVPYKKKDDPVARATFQMGWKGFVQLAQRTGLYQTINAAEVYDGQFLGEDPFKGEVNLDQSGKKSEKIVGYVAYFRLLSGFEKYLYMTKEKVEAHAKRYSQSYRNQRGPWVELFDAMALKTVVKALLSKFGPLSVEMQKAVIYDGSAVHPQTEAPQYVDTESVVTLTPPDDVETARAAEETGPEPQGEGKKDHTQSVLDAFGKAGITMSSFREYLRNYYDGAVDAAGDLHLDVLTDEDARKTITWLRGELT